MGGAIISVAVRAAIEFVASPQHQDVVQYAVNFLRPAFGAPKETEFHFRITNTTKSLILVHVDVKQSGKLCLVGYLTYVHLYWYVEVVVDKDTKTLRPFLESWPRSTAQKQVDAVPSASASTIFRRSGEG